MSADPLKLSEPGVELDPLGPTGLMYDADSDESMDALEDDLTMTDEDHKIDRLKAEKEAWLRRNGVKDGDPEDVGDTLADDRATRVENLREAKRKEMESRGVATDPMADGDNSADGVDVDVLRGEYDLETLRDAGAIDAELDDLERRVTLLEDRAPEHVETNLRPKIDALRRVKERNPQSWDGVRRAVEESA